jgi:hypothetical protein
MIARVRAHSHWIALGVAIFGCSQAGAQTFDVKQLDVQKGSLELGLDNTVHTGLQPSADLNRSAHDQSLDYGVTDRWRLSGVLKLENPLDAEFRFAKAAVENIFVLRPVPEKVGVGLGWFAAIEASVHQDTTNSLIFGPIATLKADKLTFTANPFLEKTFGRNNVEGIALNYGWQVKYELRKSFAIGIEGFGIIENLGNSPALRDQEHHIGPAIFTEIALSKDLKITPDVGLLFGLTSSTPDVALKLNIGVPLHQR